jgi:hypothetical protein
MDVKLFGVSALISFRHSGAGKQADRQTDRHALVTLDLTSIEKVFWIISQDYDD